MSTKKTDNQEQENPADKKLTCGVIMPISSINGLSEGHWLDVRNILFEVIKDAGFEPNMVSDSPDVGVIHNRIMNNIYTNEIVVCDVSEHNPNVMLELGLRLAFDKPVIIVKDYETKFNFDTSLIEHIEYPRDLRYTLIENFKIKLKSKIENTYSNIKEGVKYPTFLSHFKIYEPAKLETKEVSNFELVIKSIEDLRKDLNSVRRESLLNSTLAKNVAFNFGNEELNTKIQIKKHLKHLIEKNNLSIESLNEKDKEIFYLNLKEFLLANNYPYNRNWIKDSINEFFINPNF